MKITTELVQCSSWNEALALQIMLEAEGFPAVASTGIFRGLELHSVAVLGPIGYGDALRIAAAVFALMPEIEMRDALRLVAQDIKEDGQHPDASLLDDVQREAARGVMARAQRVAYESEGRLRKQVGAPADTRHDTWDEWKPAR